MPSIIWIVRGVAVLYIDTKRLRKPDTSSEDEVCSHTETED